VRVLEVKLDKKQIALSMKSERPAFTGGAPTGQRTTDQNRDRRGGSAPPPKAPPPRQNVPFNNPFAAALGNKLPRR
jgi:hypothetical protein